mgnify:CR=1 FL=1
MSAHLTSLLIILAFGACLLPQIAEPELPVVKDEEMPADISAVEDREPSVEPELQKLAAESEPREATPEPTPERVATPEPVIQREATPEVESAREATPNPRDVGETTPEIGNVREATPEPETHASEPAAPDVEPREASAEPCDIRESAPEVGDVREETPEPSHTKAEVHVDRTEAGPTDQTSEEPVPTADVPTESEPASASEPSQEDSIPAPEDLLQPSSQENVCSLLGFSVV